MATSAKKGFVIILMLSMMTIFLLIIVTIVGLSCSEVIQVRARNDSISAYDVAVAGAERMYTRINSTPPNGNPSWPLSISSTAIQVNGSIVGRYTVTANTISPSEFAIISTGTVNSRSSTLTVKYGFVPYVHSGVPLTSIGQIKFQGNKYWKKTSRVYIDGPIQSAGFITPTLKSPDQPPYVEFYGSVTEGISGLKKPSFWWKYIPKSETVPGHWMSKTVGDANGDEIVNAADDINQDNKVDERDAFRAYYLLELNKLLAEKVPPETVQEYVGDKTLGPYSVPAGTSVIFVDGDVNVVFNAQQWWGAPAADLTIASTGDITIVQPVNGPDDRLTLVAYRDVFTGGTNLSELTDIDGNLNIFANGNFTAVLGGNTNGSIMVGGTTYIDTVLIDALFDRNLHHGTDDWAVWPIGFPPDYPMDNSISNFAIKTETFGVANYKPRWQER